MDIADEPPVEEEELPKLPPDLQALASRLIHDPSDTAARSEFYHRHRLAQLLRRTHEGDRR